MLCILIHLVKMQFLLGLSNTENVSHLLVPLCLIFHKSCLHDKNLFFFG